MAEKSCSSPPIETANACGISSGIKARGTISWIVQCHGLTFGYIGKWAFFQLENKNFKLAPEQIKNLNEAEGGVGGGGERNFKLKFHSKFLA